MAFDPQIFNAVLSGSLKLTSLGLDFGAKMAAIKNQKPTTVEAPNLNIQLPGSKQGFDVSVLIIAVVLIFLIATIVFVTIKLA